MDGVAAETCSVFSESDVPSEEAAYWNGELDADLPDVNGCTPVDARTLHERRDLSPDTVLRLQEEEEAEPEEYMIQEGKQRVEQLELLEKDGQAVLDQHDRRDKRGWRRSARIWRTASQSSISSRGSDTSLVHRRDETDGSSAMGGTM